MLLTGASAELATLAPSLEGLTHRNWQVDVVALGTAAERCRQSWPDVVIVHTAGIAAEALRELLRWLKGSARVLVVVLTRPDQLDHRLAAIEARVDDDAIVPIEPRELVARV